MGLFRKSGVDVLDLTLLQKKGILKIKEAPKEKEVLDFTKVDRDGFVPFAASMSENKIESVESSSVSPASIPSFDFLNNNSNATNTPEPAAPVSFWDMPVTTTSIENTPKAEDLKINTDFSNLAVKVDNLEYKMDRLTEKLVLLESKLEEFGRNVR